LYSRKLSSAVRFGERVGGIRIPRALDLRHWRGRIGAALKDIKG